MVDRAKLRRWSSSSINLRKRVIETSFLYDPSYVTSHLASHAWGLPRISPFNARVASAAPAAFVLTAQRLLIAPAPISGEKSPSHNQGKAISRRATRRFAVKVNREAGVSHLRCSRH